MKLKIPVAPYPAWQLSKKNTTTALGAISVLQKSGVKISDAAIRSGFKNVAANTAFIGRWMVMGQKPEIIFDSAHNEGGLRELRKALQQTKFNHLHFVYGTVGDKDISKNLALLPKQATYYFCNADIPRALPATELQAQASEFGLKGQSFPSVKAALKAAKKASSKSDLILVAGSIFVVAEVL